MGKGSAALLDQGLVAGAGAVLSLVLARVQAPAGYGVYALAFEGFLLLAAVYGALVLEPMSVFGPSDYRERQPAYLKGLFRLQGGLVLCAALLFGGVALGTRAVGGWDGLPRALAGAMVAVLAAPIFWLARRAFYVKLAPRRAAQGAGVYALVLMGGLALVWRAGRLSPFVAFLLLAAAGLAAGAFLLRGLPREKVRESPPGWREIGRRHWEYGRWALGSGVAMWLPAALYYLLLGKFSGLTAAGAMKALYNLTSPVSHVFAALTMLSLPYASGVYHQAGPAGLRQAAWKITLLYAGGACAYWAVAVEFREPLVRLLYAGKYQSVEQLVPLLALGSILRISATAQAIALRAMQRPALVFASYGMASAAAVVVAIPAVSIFGLLGVVLTDVVANGVALSVAFFHTFRKLSTA